MRNKFASVIEQRALEDPLVVFITGDLGFNALESLQKTMGKRFINAGVAEQNLIGMAAGLAFKGFKVFCYSIAPFITYRCLEQIRLDLCIHKLPVCVVGNGGGYGYGIMGATHHAIEDLASLSSLPNIDCWVPAFTEDLDYVIDQIFERKNPSYLRLGKDHPQPNEFVIDDFFTLKQNLNSKLTILSLGPISQNVLAALEKIEESIDLFSIIRLPVTKLPEKILKSISQTQKLLVVEEHVSRGGLGENISVKVLEEGINLQKFKSLRAEGYPNELYGSQNYHQKMSGLDVENLFSTIQAMIL